jgi:hypothetical protein
VQKKHFGIRVSAAHTPTSAAVEALEDVIKRTRKSVSTVRRPHAVRLAWGGFESSPHCQVFDEKLFQLKQAAALQINQVRTSHRIDQSTRAWRRQTGQPSRIR